MIFYILSHDESVTTPLWGKCEVATHTPENESLESFGTPKNSEDDGKGQNTSHWGVLYTVEKVLKFKCPKWSYMSHLDIYNTNYGRKKDWKSNWQFNFPTTKSQESTWSRHVQMECNMPLESSWGGLQVWFRPHPNRRSGRKVMITQSLENLNWDSFGTPFWEFWEKVPFRYRCRGEVQRILYGGRWWLPPSPSRGESSECRVARGLSQHRKCLGCELTFLWLVCECRTV
jgi:hypothetical protein